MTSTHKKSPLTALFSLAAVVLLLLFGILLHNIFSQRLFEDAVYLKQDWQLHLNDEPPAQVDLSSYVFPTVHRGDTVTLETTLPPLPFSSTHMQIRIWHSTIVVLIDDVPIFTFGQEALAKQQPIGGGYQWFYLPRDAGGKRLTIQLVSGENNAFTQFVPPMLYSSAEMIEDFVIQNSPMSAIGLFLTALGMILLAFTAVLLRFRRDAIQLFWIAVLSLDIGLWVLCRYGIFQLVSTNPLINYYIEYVCLYLAPPLGLLCVYAIQNEKRHPSPFILLFLGAQLAYVPILLVLDLLNVIYIAEALRLSHMFILAASIFIFAYCFRRRHNTVERMKLFGVAVLTVFAVADLLLFTFDNLVPRGGEGIRYSLAAVGVVLFILFLLIHYGLTSVQHFFAKAENAALKKIAYTDALTGLSNRAKANEVMLAMDNAKDTNCALLLFDLNNLKETNDRLGHSAGDQLICAFSAALQDSFSPFGTVSRIGGDEFIALFSAPSPETVTAALTDMQQRIDAYNATKPPALVSVAYGEVYSREFADWDTEKLYRVADERMYARKAKMKMGRDFHP